MSADLDWWRTAVVYEVYPRSLRDADGDGVGDLEGVRQALPYLHSLGVDALWFTPWYVSPFADGGYDVADYRAIDPRLGSLADAERLIADARDHGIRTIVDIVPNHVSSAHRWFREALAAEPGSDARARFWFRAGSGPDGGEPPTHWRNNFAGPTWTRTTDREGLPGEWYLHLFDPAQPDLDWRHPDVGKEHEEILRFWFDRGVAGVRVDSAAHIMKDPSLPEDDGSHAPGAHPNLDRDEVHPVYRRWREIADGYDEPRVLVGEVWLPDAERFSRYLDREMHTAFNFDLMTRGWDAAGFRDSIDTMRVAHARVGAPCTWVLSNHDVTRPVTRYGRADTSFAFERKAWGVPTDLALGTRRARAAALLTAALPGSLYLYQGDELGLPEVEDLPRDALEDPMYLRSGGENPGRDGCRVPIPWAGEDPPFGFSHAGVRPWLPQPPAWRELSIERQSRDPDSMLSLYRRALAVRRSSADLRTGGFSWVELSSGVCAFRRGSLVSITVFDGEPVPLPSAWEIVLSSDPRIPAGCGDAAARPRPIPTDTTVWVRDPAGSIPAVPETNNMRARNGATSLRG
ncbi:glycoside hydrolase family 13 protein [Microbacterium sp. SORGH_AS_0888]|uniref:glycoside hydrolase family 13 protein n=1 Tax=Microbacterium sp. SORGH_AS_0888 TaxID=3041791 RepID=UPI00277D2FAB|nr:glycoside hydrolase family 13 protein [Microbacterium sp. SORGH_AS_0888]MDQ1130262.1 alpha-glucosidase [Microbacterium sp. SORGH_AS_0888]